MKAVIIAALLLSAAPALAAFQAPKVEDLHTYSFTDFATAIGRRYATAAERQEREGYFKANLQKIRAHNADTSSLYRMNVNHMADWSPAELKRLNGAIPRHRRNLSAKDLPNMKTGSPLDTSVSAPHSVDWRTASPPVLTAVKDQGQCGSCWAHGSVETMESQWAIATGNLFVLSQQQLTACAPNPNQCGGTGGCMGSTAELGYEFAISANGMFEEWMYPYTAYWGTTGTCSIPTNPIAKVSASFDWYSVVLANNQNLVVHTLAATGPLAVNVDASTWHFYSSGIFTGCSSTNVTLDHVVQLVGYGTDASLGHDYWIVRNSWSASFGESGFIRLLKTDVPTCATDYSPMDGVGCKNGSPTEKVCGECGILFDVSYPHAKL